jgi:hypothetical protein
VFGDLAKWIRKRLPFAQTLGDFKSGLVTFLSELKRTHEKIREVVQVDQVRDWKSWLQGTKRHVRGIGGPSAPRWFQGVARKRRLAKVSVSVCVSLCYSRSVYSTIGSLSMLAEQDTHEVFRWVTQC